MYAWNCHIEVSWTRREGGNFLIIFQTWSLTHQKLVRNKNLHIIYYYFFANEILSVGGISIKQEAIPDKQYFYFAIKHF